MLAFGLVFCTKASIFAQDDDDDDDMDDEGQMEEMDEEEWQMQMDDYNAQKTQLQQKLDALNKEIDDLKTTSANKDKDLEKCEADMYALVGTTKSGVADFRKNSKRPRRRSTAKPVHRQTPGRCTSTKSPMTKQDAYPNLPIDMLQ